MAQVMAQATPTANSSVLPSAIPLAIEVNAQTGFTTQKITDRHSSLLAQEAFPGELAALRAQHSYNLNNSANNSSSKAKHSQFANHNQLADQLIEVMPTGLVMLDGNGIVVKINQVARDLLDEPILGQPWFNVIARSFTPREDDWHEISLKDGRRVKLEITSLGDQPGQLIMITDLTETRLLQDKLAQMQRLSSLGKMVSTLAHQIRTPLSAAILYGENLSANKLTESARLNFQDKLNARLQDLEQQVNDMLLFSKSGKEQVVAPLMINELIEDTISSMEALFLKAETAVKVSLLEDNHQILANKNALMGAIQNLLHNAITALKESHNTQNGEKAISIQVYSQDSYLYLSVKDNGPGINKDIADKIFQPFYTSSSKGTGLGLAVVKSVVTAHQGEVSLLNEAGDGAHFVIKLPLLVSDQANNTTELGES